MASAVVVMESRTDWLRVVYMKGSKTRSGWVSATYVRLASAALGSSWCETEYKSGAEVCIGAVDAALDCNKSFAGEYYRDCDVSIHYDLSTDYRGRAYLDVDVSCDADISYKGRNTYFSRSDSDSASESHSLYAHGSDYGSSELNFSFSSFTEV